MPDKKADAEGEEGELLDFDEEEQAGGDADGKGKPGAEHV
eukprot:gene1742-6590_t